MTYLRNNTSAKAGVRHISEPAPTIYYGARVNTAAWVTAPDVLPKHGRQVTVAESGVLQSFRADYPWRGTRGPQYQQVGNAVPPALARTILAILAPTPGVAVYDAVDLFAGPGGWDEGARALGLRTVGVEYDHTACRTAVAAGHPRVRADVRTIPVEPFAGIPGLIASPPCPTFSAAGKGSGRHDLPLLLQAIKRLAAGEWPTEEIAACDDERTALTLEPLRWALVLRPEWIALEQVKEVLPVWQAMAEVLRGEGYSVATGVLNAEEYGVPQTRRRAVLVASRVREVTLPAPTHTRYRKGEPRQAPGLLPWVSMADALGWSHGELVGFPRRADTPSNKADQRVTIGGVDYRARDLRTTDQPAQVVTEKARSWTRSAADRTPGYGPGWPSRRPAPTILSGVNRSTSELPNGASGGAVRVTLEEAAVLQSFPGHYPWRGLRTECFRQVGNAVPPLLALAVLEAAT